MLKPNATLHANKRTLASPETKKSSWHSEQRLNAVEQNPTHAAHRDIRWAAGATDTCQRVVVDTTILLLRVLAEQPHLATLAPVWTPRILHLPKHGLRQVGNVVKAKADEDHSMTDDRVLRTSIEDPLLVQPPVVC